MLYLLSVSSLLSKLCWFLSSVIRASFAAISAGVGRVIEIGGVTPLWRVCAVAMMNMGDLLSPGNCTEVLDDERKERARSVFTESFLFTARSPAISYRCHTCE